GFVRIWDAATGRELSRLEGFQNPWCVAYSPDGKLLAVVDFEHDAIIHLWDITASKRVRTLPGRKYGQHGLTTCVASSADSKILAADNDDVGISLWNATTGAEIRRFGKNISDHDVLAFLPDGERLFAACLETGMVELWDKNGRQLLSNAE